MKYFLLFIQKVVILKSCRVIANIAMFKSNIDHLMKYNLPSVVGDVLKTMKNPNDKIFNYVTY
jgi:2-C-methyl-D-erythritol 4-phosphate cytidylyltransferase